MREYNIVFTMEQLMSMPNFMGNASIDRNDALNILNNRIKEASE